MRELTGSQMRALGWLPDEAKDHGAREAYVDLREALAKLDGAK